jgi:uncharacterized protein YbgA (DUF1722 family)/uncharacterized protein YbbK (DUF523 family)
VAAILRDRGTPRLGVSSCLLGNAVRHDGGHKRDRFLTDVLGPFVEWVPVCPELELGLGVPRPTIRLEQRGGEVRLVEPKSGRDHTRAMQQWSRRRIRELRALDLCGYVLKKSSPSCGLLRVRLWSEKSMPLRSGRGVFAAELCEALPLLPVEEEGRLNDPPLRESFVERIFAYRRLQALFRERWTRGELVAFHTAHKMQLLSHSQAHYRALGRLVAEASGGSPAALAQRYQALFMQGLAHVATARRHTNVLQHMQGHLRDRLDDPARRELAALVEDYRRGLVPLVVPVTLIRHHVARLEVAYLQGQTYLDPHPKELMIRNHV